MTPIANPITTPTQAIDEAIELMRSRGHDCDPVGLNREIKELYARCVSLPDLAAIRTEAIRECMAAIKQREDDGHGTCCHPLDALALLLSKTGSPPLDKASFMAGVESSAVFCDRVGHVKTSENLRKLAHRFFEEEATK